MKIWGPAAGRRTASEGIQRTPQNAIRGDTSAAAPPAVPQCGACNICILAPRPQLVCGRCPVKGYSGLSTNGERFVSRLKRASQLVDLIFESPPLQRVPDVSAAVRVASQLHGETLKSLRLGPWGRGRADAGCACDEGAASADDAEEVLASLASLSQSWSSWPLKTFSVIDLELSNGAPLCTVLSALPQSVLCLRLCGLGLGSKGLLQDCLSAVGVGGPLQLDLSGNGLGDGDLEPLLPMLAGNGPGDDDQGMDEHDPEMELEPQRRLKGLNLSGNPKITATGLRSLLMAARPALAQLQTLDLSECALGPEGAHLLSDHIACNRGMSVLRELTLYRVGAGPDGICRLVEAAACSPSLHGLNVVANSQHVAKWVATVGERVAHALQGTPTLRSLTISCPETELAAARALFADLPCRVILVPNEQNNYNRALFAGHVH